MTLQYHIPAISLSSFFPPLLLMLLFPNTSVGASVPKSPSSSITFLFKRDDDDGMFLSDDPNSSSWQWGRWILFILFIVGFLAVFIFTITANRRRRYNGQAPIRGTAWMTPPSYRQSEQQYHGNTQRVVEDYVPEYTEEANINDLGYYDERGEFHPNGKAEYLPPPPLVQQVDSNDSADMERPQRAVIHDSTLSNVNDHHVVNSPTSQNEFDFRRPSYTAQQYYNMSSPQPSTERSPFVEESSTHHEAVGQESSSNSTDSTNPTFKEERYTNKINIKKN